jgi:hypothetical protein
MRVQSLRALGWPRFALVVLAGCSNVSSLSLPASPQAAAGAHARAQTPPASSFSYAGTIEQTTTTRGGTKAVSLTVKEDVTAASGTYDKRPVTIYTGTETDTGTAGSVTIDSTGDVANVPSTIRTGSDVTLLASTLQDGTGLHQSIAYGEQNGVVDQLPHIPSARWNNSAARTATIVSPGTDTSDIYAANGADSQSAAFDTGGTSVLQSFPDGNANYQWPLDTVVRNSNVTFSPPAHGSIQILYTTSLPSTQPVAYLKTWYPSNPLELASDTVLDDGAVSLPPSCGAAHRFAGSATELIESKARLDIVFGEYETQTRTAYVQSAGLVCLVVHDILETYYDYTKVEFQSKPLQTVEEDETIGLRQATGTGVSASAGIEALLDAHVRMNSARHRLEEDATLYRARRKIGSAR